MEGAAAAAAAAAAGVGWGVGCVNANVTNMKLDYYSIQNSTLCICTSLRIASNQSYFHSFKRVIVSVFEDSCCFIAPSNCDCKVADIFVLFFCETSEILIYSSIFKDSRHLCSLVLRELPQDLSG